MMYDSIKNYIPFKTSQKYRVDTEFVILTNNVNKMVFLNSTAGYVFLECDGNQSIDDICKKMLTEYDVSFETLKRDIIRIIRDLQWNKLIRLYNS